MVDLAVMLNGVVRIVGASEEESLGAIMVYYT